MRAGLATTVTDALAAVEVGVGGIVGFGGVEGFWLAGVHA